MSEYTDFWKSLDLPADQSPKTQAFNTVASNADRLSLTDAEQYSLGWGPDALPEDWVKARAKEINDQIQAAESTAILRRGRGRGDKTQEEIDAEAATKALEEAKVKAGVNTPGAPVVNEGGSGGDYGAPGNSTPGVNTVNENAIDMAGKLAGIAEMASKVPGTIGVLGKIAGGAIGAVRDTQIDDISKQMAAIEAAQKDGFSARTNADGSVSSVSTQADIDAQDMANFGTTSAQMDADRAAAQAAAPTWGGTGTDYGDSGNTGSGPGSDGQTGGDMGGYGGADNGY